MIARVDWKTHEPLLREKIEAGLSAKEISLLIPNASKSAIVGMRRRLGLASNSRKAPDTPKLAPPRAPVPVEQDVTDKPPKSDAFHMPQGVKAIPLASLRNATTTKPASCRWPYDHGTDGETLFCGRPATSSVLATDAICARISRG